MGDPRMIFVDWGSTNARAFLLDEDGRIAQRRAVPCGVRSIEPGGFASALDNLAEGWRRDRRTPIVMAGMIGSRHGWIEAPYGECPVTAADLARLLVPVPRADNVWIVPGVCLPPTGRRRDVMRGEELQVFGALKIAGLTEAVLCLPGTHSKWVRAAGSTITDFATAMTGEVFQVMTHYSILGALMAERSAHDPKAFARGLDCAGEPGGLLHHLFSVRVEGLFDSVPVEGLVSYLSGILIGHEVRELSRAFAADDREILLVGAESLTGRYAEALDHLATPFHRMAGEEAAVRGLLALTAHADLAA